MISNVFLLKYNENSTRFLPYRKQIIVDNEEPEQNRKNICVPLDEHISTANS